MVSDRNHKLIIMRHSKSDWGQGFDRDFDRPISARGRRDAEKMADWLVEHPFDTELIISSPAKRAKQTANVLAKRVGLDTGTIVWDMGVYEASPGQLLKIIEKHARDYRRVILIGHNPGLDGLLNYLSAEEPETTASGKLMTTSAMAILDFKSGPIQADQHSAHLQKIIRPKELP